MSGVIRFDDVEIDLERRMVMRAGELVQLSRTEWFLLEHLAVDLTRERSCSKRSCSRRGGGPSIATSSSTCGSGCRVRRKLGAQFGAQPGAPGRVKTFQRIGYLLDAMAAPPRTTAPRGRNRRDRRSAVATPSG